MKDSKADPGIRCPSCGGQLTTENYKGYCCRCEFQPVTGINPLRRLTGYVLSIPERVFRIALGSGAGVVKGISELLLPEAVRQTRLYQVLLNKNLRYLIEDFGAVRDVYTEGTPSPPNYVARKFVGNLVELAGILTLHASPVWIFALISDISDGTKNFLREFSEALKQKGLLDPDADIDTADQLLGALQTFSGKLADQIDTPPLSVEDLYQTMEYFRNESRAFRIRKNVKSEEMQAIFVEMKDVARREKKSLFDISAAMALNTINQLERSGRKAVTGLSVGQAMLDRTIFQYYTRSLKDLSKRGYYRQLGYASKPYLNAMARHMAWKNMTWTEKYFLNHMLSQTKRNQVN